MNHQFQTPPTASYFTSMSKRKDLTLQQKADLLKELESTRMTQVAVAKKFGVSTSCVSRLVQQKNAILGGNDNNNNRGRKRNLY